MLFKTTILEALLPANGGLFDNPQLRAGCRLAPYAIQPSFENSSDTSCAGRTKDKCLFPFLFFFKKPIVLMEGSKNKLPSSILEDKYSFSTIAPHQQRPQGSMLRGVGEAFNLSLWGVITSPLLKKCSRTPKLSVLMESEG